MLCYDYDAVIFDGEVYCVECLPEDVSDDDVQPIFADQEWEYAPECCECGMVHDYVSIIPAHYDDFAHGRTFNGSE